MFTNRASATEAPPVAQHPIMSTVPGSLVAASQQQQQQQQQQQHNQQQQQQLHQQYLAQAQLGTAPAVVLMNQHPQPALQPPQWQPTWQPTAPTSTGVDGGMLPHGHLQTHVAPMPPHAAVSVVAGQSTTGAGGDIAVSLDAPPAPYASFAPLGGFAPYPAVGAPYGPSSMVYPPSGVATAFPAVSAVPVDVSLVYRAPSEHDVGGDGSGAPVVFDASVAAGNSAGAVKKQPLGFDAAVARTLDSVSVVELQERLSEMEAMVLAWIERYVVVGAVHLSSSRVLYACRSVGVAFYLMRWCIVFVVSQRSHRNKQRRARRECRVGQHGQHHSESQHGAVASRSGASLRRGLVRHQGRDTAGVVDCVDKN